MNLFGTHPSQTLDAQTLKQQLDQDTVILVDVREPFEYHKEHIPGAILVPLSRFNAQLIPQTAKRVVLYCRSGHRSAIAARKLLKAGFLDVIQLEHGIGAWRQFGYPLEVGKGAS
ncbi:MULTISPECIES: rhodanese-like domain-containing protein [unclassified Leptolyngbya]|uniref:rhodanese-like domain-containing protein n=1 Tax=unclassified Leptolyngbya TaxID=2650499 RepID=UPI001AC32CB3|nr:MULTISPECIES: rhodanese-like domain-containing protein [unclassified Leptolyngbya]MBN8564393.1 rhodanese-like domain-containing protein [Leptolyngbya sp. UWPOB_LEPTO1]MCY6493995.1 rhodanese-like domain-containing protein [Leptolyngbya sp. GGD]